MNKDKITVQGTISAPIEKVWKYYTEPTHITKWNHASEDWHSPRAENDLRVGGRFNFRMEAKDGSEGFDFGGTYTEVISNKVIAYSMDDDRKVTVRFEQANEASTHVTVSFDPEQENPTEMQQGGWQAILDNFKLYTEAN